jgi:pyruvate dehydrogenase phosphatase
VTDPTLPPSLFPSLPPSLPQITNALINAFIQVETQWITDVLAMENELQQKKKATVGACALYALIKDNILYVANAGDCRAVMGKLRHPAKEPSAPPSLVPSPVAGSMNVYEAIPMSLDHNAREEREHARLRKAHPGEDEDIVLCYHGGQACYVKGRLQPSRAFGDIHLKLEGRERGREGGREGKAWGGNSFQISFS